MDAPLALRPRLLWVNHFAVAPDMGGGTRHVELGRELVRRGWEVTIAASDFHLHRRRYLRRAGTSERAPVRETVDGVTFEWLWAAPYDGNDARRVWNWLSFGRSLRSLDLEGRHPDVVIGSTPHLFAARAALHLARRLQAPFVLEVRDLWPESLHVGGRRKGPGYFALWALARYLYRAANRIIVLAPGVGDYLAAAGVPRERIIVVPNGVDLADFPATRRNGRRTLRLVYAGAHGPANGLDAVLDAADELRADGRISFLLVGDGPARDALRADAARRGLTNVTFAGPVAKSAMPALLAGCDAGLMVLKDVPLFSFGVSPNKLFDYWGAALPVVCNVPGELAGWVGAASGGVQASDSSGAALAAVIRRLADLSPDERRGLGERGRKWVARKHDRAVLAARLDDALRETLRGYR
ncbi:MAG: glycosyltransferase family 4 protein [Gemmatimonadota bacterium]|nr:glycosyltransferase family 4 protein [Gemmatimonadota bacterium]